MTTRSAHCPRHSVPLQRRDIQGAAVDVCPECGGMYLIQGELNRIAQTSGDVEFSTIDLDSFQHEDGEGPVTCPVDTTPMAKVEFNIYSGIILDYCATCRGFWVDARELSRINDEVRALNEAAEQVPDPPLLRLVQFFWNIPVPH